MNGTTKPPSLHSPGSGHSRSRRPKARGGTVLRFVPVVLAVVILAAWETIIHVRQVSAAIIPAPSAVWHALVRYTADGTFAAHGFVTFQEIILGFIFGGIAGVVLGALIAEFKVFRASVYPYIVILQTIPKVALAPLFLIWFGFGLSSKVLLAVSMTFFPVVVNTIQGVVSSDRKLIELLQVYGASRWDVFWQVKFPSALPSIFAGLEIAIVLSVIAAVISEFVGATKGLGFLILQFNARLDTASEFATLAILSALGYALNVAVRHARRRVVFWQSDTSERQVR